MEFDHPQGASTEGLIREDSHPVEDNGEVVPNRRLQELIGTDISLVPMQYRQILAAAAQDGYYSELLTPDGVVNVCRSGRVLLRVRLGETALCPGQWEDKIATVFAQVRLMELVEQHAELRGCSESGILEIDDSLIETIHSALGIPLHMPIRCRSLTFPGARQLQVLYDDSVVASLIYNPILRLVLEFRIDAAALFETEHIIDLPYIAELNAEECESIHAAWQEEFAAAGLQAEDVSLVREELNAFAEPALRGLLRLSAERRIRVLAIGDSHFGFGDPNRRGALRLLRKMKRNGISHFAIPLAFQETPRLEQALQQKSLRSYWLSQASEHSSIAAGPEWNLMLQRAHDVGMKVVAVGAAEQEDHCRLVKRIERILDGHPDNRVLLWLENAYLAQSSTRQTSLGALLKKQLGSSSVATVATLTSQMPNAPLKLLTEGPKSGQGLRSPVLLPVSQTRRIQQLPWSLASAHSCACWDFILLYPGAEMHFQGS